MNILNESLLAESLLSSLNNSSFVAYPEYQISTASNKRMFLDIYIEYPVRCFIEIAINIQNDLDIFKRKFSYMENIYFAFNKQIVPVLIIDKKKSEGFLDTHANIPLLIMPIDLCDLSSGKKITTNIIEKYRNNISPFNKIGLKLPEYDHTKEISNTNHIKNKLKTLHDVLLPFKPIISEIQFKTLEDELIDFYSEMDSNHFTTAALRLGRLLEYILYSLATEWDVEISKLSIKKIAELRKLFDSLEERLIDYLKSPDEDKLKYKKIIKEKVKEVQIKQQDLIFELDDHNIEDSEHPINLNSLVRDIKHHFRRHDDIRNEFDLIINNDLIPKLSKNRNKAAHANISGIRSEFNQNDLLAMIEVLRTLLFHLCNIASSVRSTKAF